MNYLIGADELRLMVRTVFVQLELGWSLVDESQNLRPGQLRLMDGDFLLVHADDVPFRAGQGLFLEGEDFDFDLFEEFFRLNLLVLFHDAKPPWLHKNYTTNSHKIAIRYVEFVYFMLAFLANGCILEEEKAMNSKRTMTLNLTDQEMVVLEELSAQKDLSKTALLRQALRLYQMVDARISRGEKLFFEDPDKQKAELMVL
jgi:hypothetical protein